MAVERITNPPVENKQETTRGSEDTNAKKLVMRRTWQDRLLPLMAGIVIGLTIFFFIATFIQMSYLHWNILQSPSIDISDSTSDNLIASAETFRDRLEARQLVIRSKMEAFIITNRYRQASVSVMAGLWVRYLGFITGMILALVGASFVLGKLREPEEKIAGQLSNFQVSLATTSPGIILVFLGVILMFTTIIDKDYYKVIDTDIYLSDPSVVYQTNVTPDMTLVPTPVAQEESPLTIESTPVFRLP
jgi:hypothetical protein